MPRIPFPSDETGPVWDEARAAAPGGRLSKTMRLLGWSPLVQGLTLRRTQGLRTSALGRRFLEAVAYAVSVDNTCQR
jgi:hypothetical protein